MKLGMFVTFLTEKMSNTEWKSILTFEWRGVKLSAALPKYNDLVGVGSPDHRMSAWSAVVVAR